MRVGYCIIERFDATLGETWAKYVEWSKLTHLRELISLDCSLCPLAIKEFVAADYAHSIVEWEVVGIFDDLDFTRSRAASFPDLSKVRIVAVSREPALADFDPELGNGFRFAGFDLIDGETWISALTNCGGFEGAFTPEDLSSCGLIESPARAHEVQNALRTLFPEESHAQCTAWAVWREVERDEGSNL